MARAVQIEAYTEGRWRPAAEVCLRRGENRKEPTAFEYTLEHASAHLDDRASQAVSVRLPVGFDLVDLPTFPSFCIDLMPQGIPRRRLERRLKEQDLPASDWGVLRLGAGSPTGNLRVKEAAHEPLAQSRGVPREAVTRRGEHFLDWAESVGIPMRGATDTAGASPKLLLTEDEHGLLHADGTLPDDLARRHWLVKFPRGRSRRDDLVLACEAAYHEVARRLGLLCGAPLSYVDGALFVPRFDRAVTAAGVERYGLESIYSVLGTVEAGAALRWEDVCSAVAAVVDDPERDITELVTRDAVTLALGDPDNHGRNTSLLKTPGTVAVSPLYDFAPMFLDPEGIPRMTRWDSESHRPGPDWKAVVDAVSAWVPRTALTRRLVDLAERLREVPEWLRELGVDDEVVDAVEPRVERVRRGLRELEG